MSNEFSDKVILQKDEQVEVKPTPTLEDARAENVHVNIPKTKQELLVEYIEEYDVAEFLDQVELIKKILIDIRNNQPKATYSPSINVDKALSTVLLRKVDALFKGVLEYYRGKNDKEERNNDRDGVFNNEVHN